MEQVVQLLLSVVGPYGVVGLSTAGGLWLLAAAVVKMTPSQKDDELLLKIKNIPILGSVLSALEALSPVKRKD